MATSRPVGKLPPGLLGRLLRQHVADSPEVVVGPAIGEDAAALALDGAVLVATSDPITFATDALGHYLVHVNANDVATMGAEPRWFLATLLLPPGLDDRRIDAIFADIANACRQVGATWCGGHTEVTAGLDRPIAIGAMFGLVARDRLLRTGGARPGDLIWCTKEVPLEATALLARERPQWTRQQLGEEGWRRCCRLLHEPGISVVPEALAAAAAGAHSLHDPTEGGIITGLHAVATAAGVGVEVDGDAIPLDPAGRRLCAAAGIDPLGALASGSLLVMAPPERAVAIEAALRDAGARYRRIGRILEASEGRWIRTGGGRRPLPRFEVDEVARLFEADH